MLSPRTIGIISIIYSAGLMVLILIGGSFYFTALYFEHAVMPPGIVTGLVSFLGFVLAAGGPFLAGELNRRRIEHATDQSTALLSQKVDDVSTAIHDGVQTGIADKVKANAMVAADDLLSSNARQTQDAIQQAILTQSAVLRELMLRLPPVPLPATAPVAISAEHDLIAANRDAIHDLQAQAMSANTISTDKNTTATESLAGKFTKP